MKKIIAIVCVVATMFTFAACGKKVCEGCGKEGKTKKYTVAGQSGYLCEDCGAIADLASGFADMAK